MHPPAVIPRTETICPVKDFIQRGQTYRAHARNTFDLQPDQHRIKRNTFDKRLRPINRINDPAEGIPRASLFTILLTYNCMSRKILLDLTTDKFLRSLICRSDW